MVLEMFHVEHFAKLERRRGKESHMSKLTKPRLGRGLSSLMSVSELPIEREISVVDVKEGDNVPPPLPAGNYILDLPVDEILPNPHQPRRQFDETSIAELGASIKATGLVQPIVVRRNGDRYELIAGERRLRAAKHAKIETLPAIIREVDGLTQAQMALVENIQREDLNPLDRASAYRTLMMELGLTQAELAGRIGEDRSSVANYIRLLELSEPVRDLVRDSKLSLGHAKLLASVTDIPEQQRLANLVVSQGLSVRNLERSILQKSSPATPRPQAPTLNSAHLQDLEKSVARQLGMRVQVKASSQKGRGRLVIHYASLDQFDQLMSRMGIVTE